LFSFKSVCLPVTFFLFLRTGEPARRLCWLFLLLPRLGCVFFLDHLPLLKASAFPSLPKRAGHSRPSPRPCTFCVWVLFFGVVPRVPEPLLWPTFPLSTRPSFASFPCCHGFFILRDSLISRACSFLCRVVFFPPLSDWARLTSRSKRLAVATVFFVFFLLLSFRIPSLRFWFPLLFRCCDWAVSDFTPRALSNHLPLAPFAPSSLGLSSPFPPRQLCHPYSVFDDFSSELAFCRFLLTPFFSSCQKCSSLFSRDPLRRFARFVG